jgi:hypothetical protein
MDVVSFLTTSTFTSTREKTRRPRKVNKAEEGEEEGGNDSWSPSGHSLNSECVLFLMKKALRPC